MKNKKKLTAIIFIFCLSALTSGIASVPGNEISGSENLTPVKHGFIENKGQMKDMKGEFAANTLFKFHLMNLDFYITDKGINYIFYKAKKEKEDEDESGLAESEKKIKYTKVEMEFLNANIKKENIVFENEINGYCENYYLSNTSQPITDIKRYEKITIRNIYNGIDWVLTSADGSLKYDFIVHPGAEISQIKMKYQGGKGFKLSAEQKTMSVKTKYGTIEEGELYCYQGEKTNHVSSHYINENGVIGFRLNNYDHHKKVVIDPPLKLKWSTFYGGNGVDGPKGITTDQSGNVFICGYSSSTNLPIPAAGFNFDGTLGGALDGYVSKFSNTGVHLWATYIGGSSDDEATEIAADASGNSFVTGLTRSVNFPVTDGTQLNQGFNTSNLDGFIVKFDATGHLVWATYFGNSLEDRGHAICIDNSGNVFCTGFGVGYWSNTIPVGSEYIQNPGGGADVVILKYSNSGTLIWDTPYGGSGSDKGNDICIDLYNNIYVTGETQSTQSTFPLFLPYDGTHNGGRDIFVLRFSNSGVQQWATYYGSAGDDIGNGVETDPSGLIYIVGSTNASSFPQFGGTFTYGGGKDAVIIRFNNNLTINLARPIGGSSDDEINEVACDAFGNYFLTGKTASVNFPVQNQSPPPTGSGNYYSTYAGLGDVFITMFDKSKNLKWSTYYGGTGTDWGTSVAINNEGCLFVTGEWTGTSTVFTLNPGGGAYYQSANANTSDDAFILKFCPDCSPVPVASAGNDFTICQGQTVQIGDPAMAGTGLVFSWIPSPPGPKPAPYYLNVTPSTTTTYTFITTNASGCTNSDQMTVYVIPAPVADAGPNQNLTFACGGSNSALLGTPTIAGYNYSWTPSTYLNPTNIAQPTVTYPGGATQTIIYTVTVTEQSTGCTKTDQVSVYMVSCRTAGEDNSDIDADNSNNNLLVAPNPFNSGFYVTIKSENLSEMFNIELTDMAGRIIYSEKLVEANKSHLINLENIVSESGMYILMAYNEKAFYKKQIESVK